ncbi:MAG TPA: C40 family peptidase, partial [Dermatophilaceae bacterium]|nr:C40 family peptidase [Dermatophilaceae bacterium]
GLSACGSTSTPATQGAAATVAKKTATRTVTKAVSRSATRSTGSSSSGVKPKPSTPEVNIPGPTSGIIAIAASLTGIPYVYGGSSTSGFDCSGYTQFVYRRAGISIPRTAESQRQASHKVSNPAPGDLIFFGFPAYHVGIYAGPGKLYHASRPGTRTSLASIWTYSNVSYGRI